MPYLSTLQIRHKYQPCTRGSSLVPAEEKLSGFFDDILECAGQPCPPMALGRNSVSLMKYFHKATTQPDLLNCIKLPQPTLILHDVLAARAEMHDVLAARA